MENETTPYKFDILNVTGFLSTSILCKLIPWELGEIWLSCRTKGNPLPEVPRAIFFESCYRECRPYCSRRKDRLKIPVVNVDGTNAVETYFPVVLSIGAGLAYFFGGPKLPDGELARYRQPIGLKWSQDGPALIRKWIEAVNAPRLFDDGIPVDPKTGKIDKIVPIVREGRRWLDHSEQKDVKMRAIAKLLSAARCNQTQPAGEVR